MRKDDLSELRETCSLDVADKAGGKHVGDAADKFSPHKVWRPSLFAVEEISLGVGCSLNEVGEHLGISRERVRQIEATALRKLRATIDPELGDGRLHGPRPSTDGVALGDGRYRMVREDEDEDPDATRYDDRRLAWAPGFDESTDALAVDRAYAAYTRADVKDESAADPEET